MYEIRVDSKKNRLYLTLGKISGKDERDSLIDDLMAAVRHLRTGFTCLTDLRSYTLKDGTNDEFMRTCQEILWDAAIGKVVRVSNSENHTGHFNFETRSALWPAYAVESVACLKTAEELLDRAATAA